MEEKRRDDLAAARAQKYAPRPTGGAVMAGVVGAGVVLAADAIASRFYGWRLGDHFWISAGLVVAGFAAGLLVYGRLAWLNRGARRRERSQIDRDEGR